MFHIIHPDIARHVDFCTYLNANPMDARRYAEIKRAMAARHPHDIVAYNDGKGPLIREIEAKMHSAASAVSDQPHMAISELQRVGAAQSWHACCG